MLRDKSLIPLSRQHQHALALCVRIDTAYQSGDVDANAWQSEIQQIAEDEITMHFAAEEKDVFPIAEKFDELRALVEALKAEHRVLREGFAKAAERKLDGEALRRFSEILSQHIRKEERQLFEGLQQRMSAEELKAMGEALRAIVGDGSQLTLLPSEKARLGPKTSG
jgi:hemerythrin-like domain-containing protein